VYAAPPPFDCAATNSVCPIMTSSDTSIVSLFPPVINGPRSDTEVDLDELEREDEGVEDEGVEDSGVTDNGAARDSASAARA